MGKDKKRPPIPKPSAGILLGAGPVGYGFAAALNYVGWRNGKELSCPSCMKVTTQFLVRQDVDMGHELVCSNCGKKILFYNGTTALIPYCKVCKTPMKLLDTTDLRWYCQKDDVLFLGKTNTWQ